MKLNIRKAVATDAESIAMINISSWQKTYKDIFPSDFLNGLSDKKNLDNVIIRMEENIKSNNSYLVAESNNQIVGFCKMGRSVYKRKL